MMIRLIERIRHYLVRTYNDRMYRLRLPALMSRVSDMAFGNCGFFLTVVVQSLVDQQYDVQMMVAMPMEDAALPGLGFRD